MVLHKVLLRVDGNANRVILDVTGFYQDSKFYSSARLLKDGIYEFHISVNGKVPVEEYIRKFEGVEIIDEKVYRNGKI
ncbi:MAG: hypothetical protein V1900_01825 [Candidatus Aenigmatarchaeota archaeon]